LSRLITPCLLLSPPAGYIRSALHITTRYISARHCTRESANLAQRHVPFPLLSLSVTDNRGEASPSWPSRESNLTSNDCLPKKLSTDYKSDLYVKTFGIVQVKERARQSIWIQAARLFDFSAAPSPVRPQLRSLNRSARPGASSVCASGVG